MERASVIGGRVVWVTGASSGIGEALSLGLARAGWTVAVSARRADRLAAIADIRRLAHRHPLPKDFDPVESIRAQRLDRDEHALRPR